MSSTPLPLAYSAVDMVVELTAFFSGRRSRCTLSTTSITRSSAVATPYPVARNVVNAFADGFSTPAPYLKPTDRIHHTMQYTKIRYSVKYRTDSGRALEAGSDARRMNAQTKSRNRASSTLWGMLLLLRLLMMMMWIFRLHFEHCRNRSWPGLRARTTGCSYLWYECLACILHPAGSARNFCAHC